ncbi:MAG: hypothetical protein U0R24_14045 [Solirubrobacterales bacterium]
MSAPESDKPRDADDDEAAARLRAALAVDADLAEELEMITPMLDPRARARFESALTEELGRHERPAAAVLAALEHAARGG